MRSILRSHMKIIEIDHKHIFYAFGGGVVAVI